MIDVLTGDSSCMNMCRPDVGIVELAGVLTFVWLPSLSLHARPGWFRQCNDGCTCIFVWSVWGSVKYHPCSVASPLLSIFCKLLHMQKKAQFHFSFLCLPFPRPYLKWDTPLRTRCALSSLNFSRRDGGAPTQLLCSLCCYYCLTQISIRNVTLPPANLNISWTATVLDCVLRI